MSCLHEDIFHFLAKAEPFSKEEILKGFKLFDYDGTGKISFEKLKLVASEVKEDITDEELQVCEAQAYFPCSGRECKGLLIGKLCFVSLQQDTICYVNKKPCLRSLLVFRLYDPPSSQIPPNLVSQIFVVWQEMIDEADVDGDGEVDPEEFLRILTLSDL